MRSISHSLAVFLLAALILPATAFAAGLGPQPILLGKVDGLKDILIVDGARITFVPY